MKLRYERGALADLDVICTYIAADNREAAGRLSTRIEAVAARIAELPPHLGDVTRNRRFPAFAVRNYLPRV